MAANCSFLCILFSNWVQPRKLWLPVLECFDSGTVNCLISWTNTILRNFSLDTMARLCECHGSPFRLCWGFLFFFCPFPIDVKLLKINIPFALGSPFLWITHFLSGITKQLGAEIGPTVACVESQEQAWYAAPLVLWGHLGIENTAPLPDPQHPRDIPLRSDC